MFPTKGKRIKNIAASPPVTERHARAIADQQIFMEELQSYHRQLMLRSFDGLANGLQNGGPPPIVGP